MNNNIDKKDENMVGAGVGENTTGAKGDKISSAKIMESTKDIIKSLNLKGNQQEQLDIITRGYQRYLEEAQGVAKEEVAGLDLSNEFKDFSKQLDLFMKKLELKTNTYMSDTIAINIANSEKDFRIVHDEFMRYLEEVKEIAVSSEKESEGKDAKIEELVANVKKLNATINELKEDKEKWTKENKDLETAVAVKQDKLDKEQKERYKVEHKLETKESFLSEERLKVTNLKDKILELKNDKADLEEEKKKFGEENEGLKKDKKDLEVKLKELEVSLAELTVKNNSLEKDLKELSDAKKEVVEKTELATKLEVRNKSLETDLKELNTLKCKNIELEGTVKILEGQSKLLETTLNAINSTISSMTESKIKAEERAIKLEEENKKLLKKLEELNKKNKK